MVAQGKIKDVVVYDRAWSYETYQSFYLTADHTRLKPNLVILEPPDMEVVFETNAHGFKGADIDGARKLAAFWGDSVVFGIRAGWVEGLAAYFPGFQFLNGGLEGDTMGNIYARAIEANQRLPIAFNVILPSGNSYSSPDSFHKLLLRAVKELPNPIIATLPLSLNAKIAQVDLNPYFIINDNPNTAYLFFGNVPYSIRKAQTLAAELARMNKLAAMVAKINGLPLLDLYRRFYTEDLEHFRDDFFDIVHPRPKTYGKLQAIIYEELKNVIV